jgi:hypothetical protein
VPNGCGGVWQGACVEFFAQVNEFSGFFGRGDQWLVRGRERDSSGVIAAVFEATESFKRYVLGPRRWRASADIPNDSTHILRSPFWAVARVSRDFCDWLPRSGVPVCDADNV